MKNMYALRLSSILSLYFAVVSIFFPFASHIAATAATAGLEIVAALIAVRLEKAWARLAVSLVPFLGLALSESAAEAIGCALPAAVFAVLLTIGA